METVITVNQTTEKVNMIKKTAIKKSQHTRLSEYFRLTDSVLFCCSAKCSLVNLQPGLINPQVICSYLSLIFNLNL